MARKFRSSALAPEGLAFEEVLVDQVAMVITVCSAKIAVSTPSCSASARAHSNGTRPCWTSNGQ